jgi:hypothetical protein
VKPPVVEGSKVKFDKQGPDERRRIIERAVRLIGLDLDSIDVSGRNRLNVRLFDGNQLLATVSFRRNLGTSMRVVHSEPAKKAKPRKG